MKVLNTQHSKANRKTKCREVSSRLKLLKFFKYTTTLKLKFVCRSKSSEYNSNGLLWSYQIKLASCVKLKLFDFTVPCVGNSKNWHSSLTNVCTQAHYAGGDTCREWIVIEW